MPEGDSGEAVICELVSPDKPDVRSRRIDIQTYTAQRDQPLGMNVA